MTKEELAKFIHVVKILEDYKEEYKSGNFNNIGLLNLSSCAGELAFANAELLCIVADFCAENMTT